MSDSNEAFQFVEHFKNIELKRQVKTFGFHRSKREVFSHRFVLVFFLR